MASRIQLHELPQETLNIDDIQKVFEELLPAQIVSFYLGIRLRLLHFVVEAIHKEYLQPRDRLYRVLEKFLQKVEPRPTWRVIVDALKCPTVDLPQLAEKIERKYCPNPLPGGGSSVIPPCDTSLVTSVRSEIEVFEQRFDAMKKSTITCLEMLQISVMCVVYTLTSLRADHMNEHKVFLEEKHRCLSQSQNHWELFGSLNFYWNYLAYHLLDHLIKKLFQSETEQAVTDIQQKMKDYKKDLELFRERTSLNLFCLAQENVGDDPPPTFRRIAVKFNWSNTVTLEMVEAFRKRYMSHYNLRDCAMMLNRITTGSFTVTCFVPLSIVKILKKKRALQVLEEFNVSRLEIAGSCVYQTSVQQNVRSLASSTSRSLSTGPSSSGPPPSAEEEYHFVEQPSKEFFCPVLYGLLSQPHLTACCGKHLSREAATRIQEERGPCPLCTTPFLNTILNKHFRRQVHELRVLCRHEDRGCGWEGELSDLERHAQSCPMKNSPLMTELMRLPVYNESPMNTPEPVRRSLHKNGKRTSKKKQDSASPPSSQEHPIGAVVTDDLQKSLQKKDSELETPKTTKIALSYDSCQVSGPGLQSATANHPTHVLVELSDSSGRPCSLQQNVTAELELISEATPTKKPPAVTVAVAVTSPSRYEVSYTPRSRGQHKLHVQVNDSEINGSPFTMTVHPDPTKLGHQLKVVNDVNRPYGIAFNSQGQMLVSECFSHQIAVFDSSGHRIRTIGSRGERPEQMDGPAGIAIDDADNIYVTGYHKLQKFTRSGELIACVGQWGNREGQFHDPRGVTLHNNQVYVCDRDNHRIQVFDLDFNFIGSIDKIDTPFDVKFDTAGNMYVVEYRKMRVKVMDSSGKFMRILGEDRRLACPLALHIVDKYVYVSDYVGDCIVVYDTSGEFVTKFGKHGHKEGEFYGPYCITSCADGFIYVCDCSNCRVVAF